MTRTNREYYANNCGNRNLSSGRLHNLDFNVCPFDPALYRVDDRLEYLIGTVSWF